MIHPPPKRLRLPDGCLTESAYIGCDPLDVVCAWLQDTDRLPGVIADYAAAASFNGDPRAMHIADRAQPKASDPRPWPEAGAIRAVVANWWNGLDESVRPVVAS